MAELKEELKLAVVAKNEFHFWEKVIRFFFKIMEHQEFDARDEIKELFTWVILN